MTGKKNQEQLHKASVLTSTKEQQSPIVTKEDNAKQCESTLKKNTKINAEGTKRKIESPTSSPSASKKPHLSEIDLAILEEEIEWPVKQQYYEGLDEIQYNPNMIRSVASIDKKSSKSKANSASRMSRARENIHYQKILEFCERIKTQYMHLNDFVDYLGGVNIWHEETLSHCELIDQVLNGSYVPPEDLVQERLMDYNPNMARNFEEKRGAKNNNDAARRSRIKKAIQKEQLHESSTVIKEHVEKLKDLTRSLAGLNEKENKPV